MDAMPSLDEWSPRHDHQKVDIAFVIDCTHSMSSYIRQAQRQISTISKRISRSVPDIRLALVQYRDHPPEDRSFVTKVHNFTSSVAEMKGWVDEMSADGGGDMPDAVADGLNAALNFSFQQEATKICVLIADAPPHGLALTDRIGDNMPEGCPSNNDPVGICHQMAQKGIILYCVGCEPALGPFRDFFMGLAHITGGQYVRLNRANHLSQVIINATLEEVENENLMGYVEDHLTLEFQQNENATVDDLASSLHDVLRLNHNQTMRVRRNGEDMEPVSQLARRVSMTTSLSQARDVMAAHLADTTGNHVERTMDMAFEITALDNVQPRQCERLVRRGLARQGREPVEHVDFEMAAAED